MYDGTDPVVRWQLEEVLRHCHKESARDICNALMEFAIANDDLLRQNDDGDLVDDKTVVIVKRTA